MHMDFPLGPELLPPLPLLMGKLRPEQPRLLGFYFDVLRVILGQFLLLTLPMRVLLARMLVLLVGKRLMSK